MTTTEALNKIAFDDGCGDWLGMLSYYSDAPRHLTFCIGQAMKLYAEQAIKEDRKLVTKHVKMTGIAYGNDTSITDYEVDLNSIINCKKLELK